MLKKFKRANFTIVTLATLFLVGCSRGTFAKPKGDSSSSTSFSNSNSQNSSNPSKEDVDDETPKYLGMTVLNSLAPSNSNKNLTVDDIENIIKDFPNVEESSKSDFYVNAGSVMKVQVLIENISIVKVRSLNINDDMYDSSKLTINEKGVVVEIEAPKDPGYFSLQLKKIGFTGSDGKYAVIEPKGNDTISLAAAYTEAPVVQIVSKEVKSGSISFSVKVEHTLSMPKDSKVMAYITDGIKKVAEQEIDADKLSEVKFDHLMFDTEYQIGIAASFDLLDGNGLHYSWIYKEGLKTQSVYSFKDVSATKTSVSFSISDDFGSDSTQLVSVELKDGDEVKSTISEKDLSEKNSFNDLLSDHEYKLILNFLFDKRDYQIEYDVKTVAFTAPVVMTSFSNVTKTSASYHIDITDADSILVMDKMVLKNEKGDVLKELDKTQLDGNISDILANNTYSITCSYHYDLNDGTGAHNSETEVKFTTESYSVPTLAVSAVADETSVSYSLEATLGKDENPLVVDAVELYDGDALALDKENKPCKIEDGNMSGSFEGLFSDEEYSIHVTYHYDLKDGKGDNGDGIYHQVIQDIKSKTKKMPNPDVTLSNSDLNIGPNFVSGEIEVNQFSEGMVYDMEVKLFNEDGSELISSTKGTAFDFKNLESLKALTKYRIDYTYKYSLNTKDNAVKTGKGTKSIKTTPDFTVSDFQVADEGPIESGDNISCKFAFKNPDSHRLEISEIVINGETYPCNSSEIIEVGDKEGQIRIDLDSKKIVGDEGGETTLTLESITLTDHDDSNQLYHIALKENNTMKKMIYGNCYVKNVDFVNDQGKQVEYFTDKDDVYVQVSLFNKNDYVVDSIKVNDQLITSLERVDPNDGTTYRFKIQPNKIGFYKLNVQEINYRTQDRTYTNKLTQNACFNSVMYLKNPTINHISSVEQFFDCKGGENTITILDKDLDFKNKKYQSVEYNGVFDGNGHSIMNYGRRETIRNEASYSGLFEKGKMVLTNLKLENAYYSVKAINIGEKTSQDAYMGGFIADSDMSIISNCYVDSMSSFRLENATRKTVGQETEIGALAGRLGTGSKIKNCYNQGVVLGDGDVGGICGYFDGIMDSCYNTGNVRRISATSIGALVGNNSRRYTYYDDARNYSGITNCINLGPDRDYYTTKIGLVSSSFSINSNLNNNFSNNYNLSKLYLSAVDRGFGVQPITKQEIDSSFFEMKLGWSNAAWDFSKVDASKKIYPTLKVFKR